MSDEIVPLLMRCYHCASPCRFFSNTRSARQVKHLSRPTPSHGLRDQVLRALAVFPSDSREHATREPAGVSVVAKVAPSGAIVAPPL